MRTVFSILLALVMGVLPLAAQTAGGRQAGTGGAAPGVLSGRVLDAEVGSPVAWANVVVLSTRDSSLIAGTITDTEGRFRLDNLRPGPARLEVRFMGYHTLTLDSLRLRPGSPARDLGELQLHQAVLEGEELTVRTDRAPVEYHIDRKVVAVDQQLAAAGGSAVEILETVPSVDVSIDGTVSLRGSTSFTVLVDGRPSVLDANDALEQMPASSLESIEIITNPSARYDPEGRAGMINLITRKQKQSGTGIRLNARIGQRGNGGGDVTVTRRGQHVDLELAVDGNRRNNPGVSEGWERTTLAGQTDLLSSRGDFSRERSALGLRTGLTWRATESDQIRLALRTGTRDGGRRSTEHLNLQPASGEDFRSNSVSNSTRDNRFFSTSLDGEHRFARKGHTIALGAQLSHRTGEEQSEELTRALDGRALSGSISREDGPQDNMEFTLDYTLPLGSGEWDQGGGSLLELGARSTFEDGTDQLSTSELDTLTQYYDMLPDASREITTTERVHAVYGLLSSRVGPLGVKGGLRVEQDDRTVAGLDSSVTRLQTDLFPSLHLSWELRPGNTLSLSGSRRIDRPRGWFLEPGLTRVNSYTVRTGNPDLSPEYINSFELGWQRVFAGGRSLSTETWYRTTSNLMEFMTVVQPDGSRLQSPINAGSERSLGLELGWSQDLNSWWNLNLMGSLSRIRLTGDPRLGTGDSDRSSWNTRMQNRIKLGPLTRIQLDGNYHSPQPTTQGESAGFATVSLSVRQQSADRRLSLTLQANDLLDQARHEMTTRRTDYSAFRRFQPESPSLQMILSWTLDPDRRDRDKPTREPMDFEDDGF
ncbi:MAG: TonB-dependent receptor [Candidatus Delongbacteria bacterium]|nr:TonB-dependent receptor [Candidatus Delongbacteria bacterium]